MVPLLFRFTGWLSFDSDSVSDSKRSCFSIVSIEENKQSQDGQFRSQMSILLFEDVNFNYFIRFISLKFVKYRLNSLISKNTQTFYDIFRNSGFNNTFSSRGKINAYFRKGYVQNILLFGLAEHSLDDPQSGAGRCSGQTKSFTKINSLELEKYLLWKPKNLQFSPHVT